VNDGGIFNDSFIANFLLSVTVILEPQIMSNTKSVRIWQSYGTK